MYDPLNTPISSYPSSITIARSISFLLLVLLPPSKSNLMLHGCNQIQAQQCIYNNMSVWLAISTLLYITMNVYPNTLVCLELAAYLNNYTKDTLIRVLPSKWIAIMVSKQWCHLWLNNICSTILSLSYITNTSTHIMSIH